MTEAERRATGWSIGSASAGVAGVERVRVCWASATGDEVGAFAPENNSSKLGCDGCAGATGWADAYRAGAGWATGGCAAVALATPALGGVDAAGRLGACGSDACDCCCVHEGGTGASAVPN
ncbi:hypothetical protein [Agromyces lapidis]|uniref:Uncharacterized protein n=1 Tax=Agromyces lapidis TaxID=279574 RepID=A0ABV5ST33_9MICO|nr:hypothetical protein [Agromyces lapidis]